MHHFHYRGSRLYCEEVPVGEIAREVGTPFYLYSHATLTHHFRVFDGAFEGLDHLTCFSVKSNSNIAILKLFAGQGGGADIVSGGELYRALKAGVEPDKIVYSGVGKSFEDMAYALEAGILIFNAESDQEVLRLNEVAARTGKKARIAVRVNPDIDPQTHPYISTGLRENKFGIPIETALETYTTAAGLPHLEVAGLSCHIGSQLTRVSPFVDALEKLLGLIRRLEGMGIGIRFLDLGGGLGITYEGESPPNPGEYAGALKRRLKPKGLTLILEPGRVIAGNAGILVTKVLYTKSYHGKNFIIVDGAMNDLMRPALYGSYHGIQAVELSERPRIRADIVGPVCESGDFFAKNREVDGFGRDELLAVMSAGAYGFSMSSNYNSRPRAAEVMVKGNRYYIIRTRETYDDLIRGEVIPEFL